MHAHTFLGDARCNNNKNNKKNQPTNKQNNRGFCNISCIALSVSSPITVRWICTLCMWPVVLLHTHWTRRSCNFIHSCWWKPGWMFAKFTSKSVNTQKSVVLKITCMSNHTNIEHVCNIIVSVSVWHWMAWLGMHRWACGATHVKLAVSISLHMCMLSCCWLYGTFGTRSKCNRPAHSQFVHHPVWVSEKTNYFNHFYLYFCHSVSEWTKRKSNWQMSSKRIKFGFVCPFYANACVHYARYRKKKENWFHVHRVHRKLMFRQCKGHSCNQ